MNCDHDFKPIIFITCEHPLRLIWATIHLISLGNSCTFVILKNNFKNVDRSSLNAQFRKTHRLSSKFTTHYKLHIINETWYKNLCNSQLNISINKAVN